jgi:transcriptional regulator with PAS, ATPase and Fis domain
LRKTETGSRSANWTLRTVKAALTKTGGNKARAAKVLGVGRATLYRFLGDHPQVLTDE